MKRLGIIGTAGRGPDGEKMTSETWDKMMHVTRLTSINSHSDILVSGGASWADHCAVKLFLEYSDKFFLKLYLPVKFDGKFDENELKTPFNCGQILNFYHKKFSDTIGEDSLKQISEAIKLGAKVESGKGFHGRNTQIAQNSDFMLAFTFGNGKSLKDGGTKDTWDKFMKREDRDFGFHYNLNESKMYRLDTKIVGEWIY